MDTFKCLKFLGLFVAGLAITLNIGCKKGDSNRRDDQNRHILLAEVGDQQISLADLEQEFKEQNPMISFRTISSNRKLELLEKIAEREALFLKAKQLGLDEHPEVILALKRLLARQLVKQFRENYSKENTVSIEKIAHYYKENADRFQIPAKVRLQLIFINGPVSDMKKRSIAEEKTIDLLKQLKAAPNNRMLFRNLASKYSDDSKTKDRGGSISYKSQKELAAEYGGAFAESAFSLNRSNPLSNIIAHDHVH